MCIFASCPFHKAQHSLSWGFLGFFCYHLWLIFFSVEVNKSCVTLLLCHCISREKRNSSVTRRSVYTCLLDWRSLVYTLSELYLWYSMITNRFISHLVMLVMEKGKKRKKSLGPQMHCLYFVIKPQIWQMLIFFIN